MRPLALLLAGALIAAPVAAGRIEMTAEEHAQCESEGGCIVITVRAVRSIYREGVEAGRASCKAQI